MSFESWLDSIKGLYPGGIPLKLIEEARQISAKPKPGANIREVKVIFFADTGVSLPEGGEKELFEAIVSKGLKLDMGEAAFVAAGGVKSIEDVKKELAGLKAVCGIVLGTGLFTRLTGAVEVKRRGWADLYSVPSVVTHALSEVVKDPGLKRSMWEDLKLVYGKLNEK